ncbi:MAG: hypothetical protein AAGG53_07920 [Cyanobacteria bacterium P01_H01_bin.152]
MSSDAETIKAKALVQTFQDTVCVHPLSTIASDRPKLFLCQNQNGAQTRQNDVAGLRIDKDRI